MQHHIARDAAEKPSVEAVHAPRTGHDEVRVVLGSRCDGLLRRVAGPNLRLCRDPVPREPCGHHQGEALVALKQRLAVGFERQAAHRVQAHHQLEGGRVGRRNAEGGCREPVECPPGGQHVGNELRARRSVGCHQQTRCARPPGDQDQQPARSTTSADTEPSSIDAIGPWPREPSTMRSAAMAAAASTITPDARPRTTRLSTDQSRSLKVAANRTSVASASRRTASAASASRAPPAARVRRTTQQECRTP